MFSASKTWAHYPSRWGHQTPDWYKTKVHVWPLTAVHQEMVDIFTAHKFMKANCIAAQLHRDVFQVIQQLVAIGKPLQKSSHANKKNKK